MTYYDLIVRTAFNASMLLLVMKHQADRQTLEDVEYTGAPITVMSDHNIAEYVQFL